MIKGVSKMLEVSSLCRSRDCSCKGSYLSYLLAFLLRAQNMHLVCTAR